jgi:cytochrome c biogenesis protein CcdA
MLPVKRIIKLFDEKSPCKLCLIAACCSDICDKKKNWDSHNHTITLPLIFIALFFALGAALTSVMIGSIMHLLGLINHEELKKFDPFPDEMEPY